MQLKELLNGIEYTGEVPDVCIEGLTADSRQLEKGWVFVCQRGQRFDGHSFASKALELGAAAVVTSQDLGLPRQIVVEDTQAAYPLMCANFFGRPAQKMKLIGVTGTNGKTTSTFLIRHLLTVLGHHTGLIGTVQNQIGPLVLPSKFTTPDPYQLQSLLAKMAADGCEYVVMEVSSHALAQHRVDGLYFDVALFTNLTQDHLDYHHTMEEYFAEKCKLFSRCGTAVVNVDDPYGQRIAQEAGCPVVRFATQQDSADYVARNIHSRADGSNFVLMHDGELQKVSIPTPGDFSIHNALGAVAAVVAAGADLHRVVEAVANVAGVPGRFERIPTELDFTIIRDYAHTPDGIEKCLSTVREFARGRIVALFGCPGCRDGSKRANMAAAVARYADLAILTSDNPREEDEQKIIDDALPGLLAGGKPYKIFLDRYEAIEYALKTCQQGDILLLLGKGHEDYQVLSSGAIYFDESTIVPDIARRIAGQRGI